MLSFAVPPVTLDILDGDIAAEATDAIVNAANTAFWMGAGVAGAIKARGGRQIEREAMAQGPVEPGECVVTAGGQLKARFVIHAAVMGQDLRTSALLIGRATRNALAAADARGLTSIALPALGTGVGGFAVSECARVMIAAVRDHAAGVTALKLVRCVLFGQAAYRVFAEVAGDMLGTPLERDPDCPLSS
jgi:O-acetyl-ADP-ribose deacetylase (regulator of RNase III)